VARACRTAGATRAQAALGAPRKGVAIASDTGLAVWLRDGRLGFVLVITLGW
jgi:hypothetical protein